MDQKYSDRFVFLVESTIENFPELKNKELEFYKTYDKNSSLNNFYTLLSPDIDQLKKSNQLDRANLLSKYRYLLDEENDKDRKFMVGRLINTFPEFTKQITQIDEFYELPFVDYEQLLIPETKVWIETENSKKLKKLGNFLEELMNDNIERRRAPEIVITCFLEAIYFENKDLIKPLSPYLHKKTIRALNQITNGFN